MFNLHVFNMSKLFGKVLATFLPNIFIHSLSPSPK